MELDIAAEGSMLSAENDEDVIDLRWESDDEGAEMTVWVTVADVRAFTNLGRMLREAAVSHSAPLHPVQREVPVRDAGIGEAQYERRIPGAIYRGTEEVLSIIGPKVSRVTGPGASETAKSAMPAPPKAKVCPREAEPRRARCRGRARRSTPTGCGVSAAVFIRR